MEIIIDYLNDLGVGVGNFLGKKIFVAYTLPGEKIIAKERIVNKDYIVADLVEVNQPSPHRIEPLCKHFTSCGGCSLQHLNKEQYLKFKEMVFHKALTKAGFGKITGKVNLIGPYTRRRASLKVSVQGKNIYLGYYKSASHEIIDIEQCPILELPLFNIIQRLKPFIASLDVAKSITDITASLSDSGLDIILKATKQPTLEDQQLIAGFAVTNDIARMSWEVENQKLYPIINRNNVQAMLGKKHIAIPAGSFMQAAKISQQYITNLILKYSKSHKKIIDLFAGCGTYSFPMAEFSQIHAVEGSADMVKSISTQSTGHRITSEQRDLFKNPLLSTELNQFSAIVINPPRNGAEQQIKNIALSKVKLVIMVSCNPVTFSRDAKALREANFKLTQAEAVDQFHFSHHLELIGIFRNTT